MPEEINPQINCIVCDHSDTCRAWYELQRLTRVLGAFYDYRNFPKVSDDMSKAFGNHCQHFVDRHE